jgi:hypothetical protein
MTPNIDIVKDFSKLQADNKELGETNVLLAREVIRLRMALEEIERIYVDGDDTHEDWKAMGEIARKAVNNDYNTEWKQNGYFCGHETTTTCCMCNDHGVIRSTKKQKHRKTCLICKGRGGPGCCENRGFQEWESYELF